MKLYKITITGKVQGVFFRKYTEQKANELGIKGVVKNLDDGSVYIEAESDEKVLHQFIEWCYEGSPYSKVEQVKWEEGNIMNYRDFIITK